jgi:hypothetical protein
MGLSLVTRAEYKAYAGISSTSSDATLDSLIPKVSELVKSICRRSFVDYVNDAKIDYTDGGTKTIELSEFPVIAVNSVEVSTDYGATYTTLTEFTDYVFAKSKNNIRPLPISSSLDSASINSTVWRGSYANKSDLIFQELINGYRVTYNAGYETLPEDLKLAVFDLIAFYIRNDSAIHTSKSVSPNTMQIEYVSSTNLPAHIKRVLDLYTVSYD